MTKIVQFQTNFSAGELDPLLKARTDLQQYQNALEEATNVTVQPQGGVRRRDGLKFIHNFGTSFTDFKIIPFEYSTSDSYTLVFVNDRMYIFKNSVLQTNINSSGNDYLASTGVTSAMIPDLNFTQAIDTLILAHEDLETKRIVRNSDTSWTISNLPLTNIPRHAYTISTTAGSSIGTHDHLDPDGTTGNFKLHAETSGGGSQNIFTASASTYIGQYINVSPFGRLRIVDKVNDNTLKVYAEVPLFNGDNIDDSDWELETGYENTWSSTRGWPKSATFHEGRLYFGGAKSRPNTIWGSKVVDYFNFDVGTALDDESVEATINTSQLNSIHFLQSGVDLQIFTTGGEFVVQQSGSDPITPSNFLIKPQSRIGSKPGVPIEDLNGATIFVQRQGKSLISFQFSDTTASYGSAPLSVFSSHLLKGPSDLAIRRASSTDETDRLFIVNDDDGSMTVYSILASQNVIAPSKFTTDGLFKAVGVEVDKTFVIVRRNVNGANNYYLERFDGTLTTDSATNGTTGANVAMEHLANKGVKVIRDGVVEADKLVPSVSPYTVVFDSAATLSFEVGLSYDVTVKTMPAEPKLAGGSVQGVKKRIIQIDALVFETQNMTINSKEIAFRNFGESVLDIPVQEFTGTKTAHGFLGFSSTGQITVSQSAPLKMTLLGLEYRLSVGN
jgi:hypothetical protein